MHTHTLDQIKWCEDLSKLIEKQTGVKREPKVGEWWYGDGELSGVRINEPCLVMTNHSPGLKMVYAGNIMVGIIIRNDWLLHPLYSVEEVLEILRIEIQKCNEAKNFIEGKDIFDKIGYVIISNNLLTALLKLAIEIQERE